MQLIRLSDFKIWRGWKKIRWYRIRQFEKLVGKQEFWSLDKPSRDFLVDAAGIVDFGVPIDIEKVYNYDIYDD